LSFITRPLQIFLTSHKFFVLTASVFQARNAVSSSNPNRATEMHVKTQEINGKSSQKEDAWGVPRRSGSRALGSKEILTLTAFTTKVHFRCSVWVLRRDSISGQAWCRRRINPQTRWGGANGLKTHETHETSLRERVCERWKSHETSLRAVGVAFCAPKFGQGGSRAECFRKVKAVLHYIFFQYLFPYSVFSTAV